MKKMISMVCLVALVLLAGCQTNTAGSGFQSDKMISVISREDGSGTRGAFVELFGIEEKNDDGTKKDLTTKEAIIAKQTDVMMTNIAGDIYAIGYISLGSLSSTVKALSIEGVTATTAHVKDGTYPIARPFNIATRGELSELSADFIRFMMSATGQEIVGKSYITVVDDAAAFQSSLPGGKLVIAGSSSVSPLMEKLIEAYRALNANAEIELQTNDSSSGMNGAIDGTCDIGMASRDLKDSEQAVLTSMAIALDGIAVVVHPDNPLEGLSKEQVKGIFTGELDMWNDVVS